MCVNERRGAMTTTEIVLPYTLSYTYVKIKLLTEGLKGEDRYF